jgi:hypothetical protein
MDLIDPKAPEKLESYGGIEGILRGLHADPVKGLATATGGKSLDHVTTNTHGEKPSTVSSGYQMGNVDTLAVSFADREQFFGKNVLPKRKPKSIFQLMWIALHEKILVSAHRMVWCQFFFHFRVVSFTAFYFFIFWGGFLLWSKKEGNKRKNGAWLRKIIEHG